MLEGFDTVSRIQMFWRLAEETSLSLEQRKKHLDLTITVIGLYADIFEYQARVICHLSNDQVRRGTKNVLGGIDWKELAGKIKKSDEDCRELLPTLEHQNIQKQWQAQLRDMSETRKILVDIRSLLQHQREGSERQFEDEKEAKLLQLLHSNYKEGKDFNAKRVHDTCR